MKTKFLASLFLAITFFSCKNEEKNEVVKKEKPKTETFDVDIDLVIKADEELILLYKDGSNQWFDDDHTVWLGVKGSPEVQTAKFSLPEGVVATDLRFDIGRNEFKKLEPVEIKKIVITYKGKKFEIGQGQINDYFATNEFIEFDPTSLKYSFKPNSKGEYDPYFQSKEPLLGELIKVVQ